ncbi:MAG TPA: FAD-dependent monooxygenase [Nitrospirales bacterium]|jgi:2-polyprenyl-6-methoxyphenol hydroxylase-like FAD-dependent oxidoreductase
MTIPENIDVLIVGAGPTGLMLGNQLGRRDVRAVIIDRNQGPSIQTKALGVQARTLEIYSHLGIVERALELGTRATGANMWTGGRPAARVPLGDIGRDLSPYPFVLILGQDDNERLLGEALRKRGMDVQWSTELVGLLQTTDHVSATLKGADGSTREIKATWVAGCDGPHSAVRALNGITFPGAPYEHVFFVADTSLTGPMVPGELNVFLFRDGFHLFFPMRGANHWRVVGIVPQHLRARDDLDFASVFPSIREQVTGTLSFQECHWFSTYRIHHRRAERFRDRRCFLLGDAAHIHSPVGAQGMNTGLQDAYNLGWKLALVVSERAGGTLLDSYETERVPVAERLLKTTDQAFSLIVSDRWLAGIFRTRVLAKILAIAMTFDPIRKLAFRTISQIGIHYRKSPFSETAVGFPTGAPQAGDRFPWLQLRLFSNAPAEDLFARLDDTRFNLIVIGQPLPGDLPDFSGLIQVLQIPDDPINDREFARAGIPKPCFYLLRPDGHIGLAGAHLHAAALTRYLAERLDLQTAAAVDERRGNVDTLKKA